MILLLVDVLTIACLSWKNQSGVGLKKTEKEYEVDKEKSIDKKGIVSSQNYLTIGLKGSQVNKKKGRKNMKFIFKFYILGPFNITDKFEIDYLL